ncbi:MAG: ribosome biogenesis GTPase Der, partial [Saprospiraceae bacterium]
CVDTTTGITDLDEEIAELLRRTPKPVMLCVNKVDNSRRMIDANEFWSLGFDNTFFVAALTGSGTGDLLDAVIEHITDADEKEDELPKFAIIGQPNVGKSSFINALLGEDRNIVTDIAGTTRDSIHSRYTKFNKDFLLIDTAGLRKKSKVHENLEFYSVMRAIRALEEADVCLLLLDASEGIESQDLNILKLVQKRHKGLVILVNKWDLAEEKETNSARDFENAIKERIKPFDDVPVVFISVLEKQRIFKAIEAAMEVYENRTRRIKTSALNDKFLELIENYPPPSYRGNHIKIKYITQLPLAYPAFAFFCNHPKHIKESYRNFLENKMREFFNFKGVPIAMFFRDK